MEGWGFLVHLYYLYGVEQTGSLQGMKEIPSGPLDSHAQASLCTGDATLSSPGL